VFTEAGEVLDETTKAFLTDFMGEFRTHTERVLTVLPRT
jgi:chromate reductase